MSKKNLQIKVPPLCEKHQQLLVQQSGYLEVEPWRAMIVVSNIALFQGASADSKVQERIMGDITKIEHVGCLACLKPDIFGEVVEAAKTKDIGKIKALGESYVKGQSNEGKK